MRLYLAQVFTHPTYTRANEIIFGTDRLGLSSKQPIIKRGGVKWNYILPEYASDKQISYYSHTHTHKK